MRGELRDILIRRANGEEFDMREWLAIRRLRFYENAERAFANSISQTAMQLSFVKRARVDLQTSLGGRKGAGGVDVAGALAEDDSGILGWQLRGYAAEHGTKGLNSGLFYRRVVGGALAGVNVFADYEDGDDGDFWRWSVGGDVKNRFGELSANHYFAITDAQMVGDKKTYTREGYDVDVAARIPRLEWAKARVGYYNFKGEFGDADEDGLRAGLDLSPGEGVVFGVEYDGEDGSFGGNISYTHTFGETQQDAQRAGDFNPRAHFYDAVRREYSQRISRAESGGGGNAVDVNSNINVFVFGSDDFTALTITSGSFQLPATGAVTATTHATGNDGDVTLSQGWELVVGNNATIVFHRGPTATLAVTGGRGTFRRNNANITLMQIGGADITLLGTHFDFDADANPPVITLREGGLEVPATGVNVSVLDTGASVLVNGMTVGCGVSLALSEGNVSGNCAIARGGFGDPSSGINGTVTAGINNDSAVGLFTLSSTDDIMATTETPGFYILTAGGFQLVISQTTAAQPMPEPIIANMIISADLQTTRTVFFTVVVNPPAIGVGFAGDTNTFSPIVAGNLIVGTLTIGGGYSADNIIIAGQSQNGGFALQNASVLVISGDTARTAVVTVRGDDNNGNTPAAFLTQAVTIGDPITRPFCSSGSTCRTFTVTAHNISDMSTPQFTVGSANLRFVEGGQTVQTEKVLVTLIGGAAAFTVTDEQVRGMLGGAGSITASVLLNAGQTQTIRTDVRMTTRVDYPAINSYAVVTNSGPLFVSITRTSTPFAGANVVMTINRNFSTRQDLIIVETDNAAVLGNIGVAVLIPFTARDYTVTIAANNAIRGITVIAPLGAGGTGDSALLELEFSQAQLWQVSYLPKATPNPNLNPNISPPPSPFASAAPRRPRRTLTPT